MTLATTPEEYYRALIEATAYGTRIIIETLSSMALPVTEIVATGGLPDRNKLLMQDCARRLGADDRGVGQSRAARSVRPCTARSRRKAAASTTSSTTAASDGAPPAGYLHAQPGAKAVYDRLFAEYVKLHRLGRGENDVMKRLKALKAEVFDSRRFQVSVTVS